MNTKHDLYLGDCEEILKILPDNSVDLIFTSPPYADQRKNTYGGINPEYQEEYYIIGKNNFLETTFEPTLFYSREKMKLLKLEDIYEYVENNIYIFHEKRIASLDSLKLSQILKKINPYLYKVKSVITTQDIVKGIVEAHISSSEETIFGDWLEGLAIFINEKVYGGWKSGMKGIDLEFNKDDIRYIVNIKSDPNWGNSSQVKKMIEDFKTAKKTLRTSNSGLQIVSVNGCCYGRDNNPDKGDYFKYCGQKFWQFISGNSELYVELIEPLGHKAKEKNDEFLESYAKVINRFTVEFAESFCNADGSINWEKLVEFNSAINFS